MAKRSDTEEITLLFDSFMIESQNLYNSFIAAGIGCNTVVINDDGFLPDGVISMYQYFTGTDKALGKPRYFNQVDVPDYWEINSTNNSGTINDKGRLKGRIFYANPTNKRIVRAVEWLDDTGKVRLCDYYNRVGLLYARATFDKNQKLILKSYFDMKSREIIVENYITNDITLNYNEKVLIFKNKTEFVLYYLEETGLNKTRLFINSLGTPFFVSNSLGVDKKLPIKSDILFWQEYPRDDVPGNMSYILEGKSPRIHDIYVQKKASYDKLINNGLDKSKVHSLGFVYPFVRHTHHNNEALILTNSDKIDHIADIVREREMIHFHIAAITEMSTKLMSLDKYDNVTLYPTVTMWRVDDLYGKCDIYLDINRENEILRAVSRAFYNNQLIFGFKETMHNINYIDENNRYNSDDYVDMIKAIKHVAYDEAVWDDRLKSQKEYALSEEIDKYLEL